MQGTGQLALVDSCDLIFLLVSHPKMKALKVEATKAFVQRETGAISGFERMVQAATVPTPGQQFLQRGSGFAIPGGISHEESSTSVNSEGNEVVERLVERGVLLPNGQGIQIQQAAQQVIAPSDSDLGKRKIPDDLETVQNRLRNLECDKFIMETKQMEKQFSIDNDRKKLENEQIKIQNDEKIIENDRKKAENEQKKLDNKVSTMNNFSKTMEMLNSNWKDDKRLILQMTDYMKNGIFNGSSAQQIENGPAQSESISISSVAFELGLSISNGQAKKAGKIAAAAYLERYQESPSKHHQTVGGNVILVNSYTQKDRDLLESAIKGIA